jgi:hypothetical protein
MKYSFVSRAVSLLLERRVCVYATRWTGFVSLGYIFMSLGSLKRGLTIVGYSYNGIIIGSTIPIRRLLLLQRLHTHRLLLDTRGTRVHASILHVMLCLMLPLAIPYTSRQLLQAVLTTGSTTRNKRLCHGSWPSVVWSRFPTSFSSLRQSGTHYHVNACRTGNRLERAKI